MPCVRSGRRDRWAIWPDGTRPSRWWSYHMEPTLWLAVVGQSFQGCVERSLLAPSGMDEAWVELPPGVAQRRRLDPVAAVPYQPDRLGQGVKQPAVGTASPAAPCPHAAPGRATARRQAATPEHAPGGAIPAESPFRREFHWLRIRDGLRMSSGSRRRCCLRPGYSRRTGSWSRDVRDTTRSRVAVRACLP